MKMAVTSWRRWIENESPNLVAWLVACAAAYLVWLAIVSLWEGRIAEVSGVVAAAIVFFSVLRLWQIARDDRPHDWHG